MNDKKKEDLGYRPLRGLAVVSIGSLILGPTLISLLNWLENGTWITVSIQSAAPMIALLFVVGCFIILWGWLLTFVESRSSRKR